MSGLSPEADCGKSYFANNLENKIIGGTNAVANSWPSLAALFVRSQAQDGIASEWSQFCGGTLIDKETVLTAAQ